MLRTRQKIGKYRITSRIASGPLANVYSAYDTIHKQRVALKIPKSGEHTGDEEFLHEVQVAARLRHRNILSVINASYIDDHFVIAMELGEQSLADRLERRMSLVRAMDLAGQALAALAHAHEHKIIHCDIKPGHLLLDPDTGTVYLIDFELAIKKSGVLKGISMDYASPEQHTLVEQLRGTPENVPLEAISFFLSIDGKADIYSTGAIFYEILTGQKWHEKKRPPGEFNKSIPPKLEEILMATLEENPANRIATAMQLKQSLETLI